MTTDREAARALRALFDDDITVLPDRVLDQVLTELPANRQQRWGPWSRLAAVRPLMTAAVLVVLLTLMTAVAVRYQGSADHPTPSPAPTGAAAPSASVAPGYGTAPPGWPTPAPLAPVGALAAVHGAALPDDLVGRRFNAGPRDVQGSQALVLELRSADDPHCTALYGGASTCFTILWTPNYPKHVTDPGVRGSARIVDGRLELRFDLVPFDEPCVGTISTYDISPDRSRLTGVDVPDCSFSGFTAH